MLKSKETLNKSVRGEYFPFAPFDTPCYARHSGRTGNVSNHSFGLIQCFPKLRNFWLAPFMGCLLLVQGCSEKATAPVAAMEAAPDFKMELFEGGDFQLSAQKGKIVVINFFASWCVSCGEETPVIEKASKKYVMQPVVFLAIAVDDTEKKARAFMKKIGLTIPAGLDKTGKIKDDYGIYGMPTTFFIDKNGKVSYFHAGVVTEELLKHEIDKLL